jgi:hypothetical protein
MSTRTCGVDLTRILGGQTYCCGRCSNDGTLELLEKGLIALIIASVRQMESQLSKLIGVLW